MGVNKNIHVYCTNCAEFRLDDEGIPYCPYEDKCDIWDCEDSKPLKQRPYYVENPKNKPNCFTPNNDPYPLCGGANNKLCIHCCLYEDFPDDYGY